MSLVIPGLPKKTSKAYMPGVTGGASSTAIEEPPSLAERFGYSEGSARPDTDDAGARAGVLSRGSVIGSMLEDPGGDRRAARNAQVPEGSPAEMIQTPTSRESAIERDYLQAQVAPAEAAEQRRQEAIAWEASQIEQEQKRAAGEAARRFEETYGVPYDKEASKFILDAERTQAIENDYAQKVKVLQSYLGAGVDSFGKPYDQTRYSDDLKKLGISRGLSLRAPAGYFQAVAPPDPYGMNQYNPGSTVDQSLPPTQ